MRALVMHYFVTSNEPQMQGHRETLLRAASGDGKARALISRLYTIVNGQRQWNAKRFPMEFGDLYLSRPTDPGGFETPPTVFGRLGK